MDGGVSLDDAGVLELPVVTPLPEAIAAGVFGMTDAGPIHPDADDAAWIIEQHAGFTFQVLVDLIHVEQCAEHGLDYRTDRQWKALRKSPWVEESTRRELTRLRDLYSGCISSCADAFGADAGEQFDAAVRSCLKTVKATEPEKIVQKKLF